MTTIEAKCPICTNKFMMCVDAADLSNSAAMPCYDAALAELRKLLADCIKNRDEADPELEDEKWKGFIQGVEMAIYRLEMHNAS